ncbi:kelch-like protein 10 [Dendroctonus ponderosae]
MSFAVKLRPLPSKRKPLRVGGTVKRRKPISSVKCKRCNSTPLASRPQEFPTIWEELRANNQLCDGVVKCEDNVQFNIHRIILSSISPYFRALFTNSINRGRQEVREANVNISSSAFKVILDFAYTGSCVLDKSNVFEVLKYADQYEIMDVVQNCCQFLLKDLSPPNCLQVLRFAHQFHCQYLATKANMFLLQNFSEVLSQNPQFGSLTSQHLQEILTSDYLNVKSEEVVVQAIQLWIGEVPEARRAHLLQLLKCVRMGCLSAEKLMKIARWPLIEADTSCSLYIADVLTIMEDLEGDCLDTYLTRPRIPYDILFAIGGWSAGSPTSFVETYDNRADRWLVSKDTDIVARAYHGMCSFGEKIYLVGGFDGNEYFNTVRCFDPSNHTWSDCACMYYSRCYVSVVECSGKIYAMGGYNGRIRMSSAERFDPLRNQWELLPAMQKQRSDASAASLNNKVYIVGGFNGQEVINSAEMFDPLTNQWSFIPPMISARSGVSLIAHHNALYAIGGFNGTTRLPSTEKFIPDSSSSPAWMEMSDMMTPRSNFGTVILDDCIYVIGGFNGSTTINYVEYFDMETGEWMDAASMNLNRSALSACVISGLPNSKDYSFLDRSQRRQNKEAKDGV